MNIHEPIYCGRIPQVRYCTNARTHLTDIHFKSDLYKAILKKISYDLPHITTDWYKENRLLQKAIHCMVDLFLKEVERGHIFCDDLFASTFNKYNRSDIPCYCNQEIPCIICNDFCLHYIKHFYKLIEKLYQIDVMTDEIAKQTMLNGRYMNDILVSAMLHFHSTVIRQMEENEDIPYLHTKNNLHDVIARLQQESPKPVIRKLNTGKLPTRTMKEASKSSYLMEDDGIRIDVCAPSPSFPGDGDAIFVYIQRNIRYPKEALQNHQEGEVCIRFTVKQDGTFYNVRVVRSSGDAALDREALRVIQTMPQWKPAYGVDINKTWENVVTVRFRLAN